jgi:hypothetical protein
MKTTLILTLTALTLVSVAQAKPLFGTIEKYVDIKTGRVVDIATNETEDFDMSRYSPIAKEEIAGVAAGERILLTTYVNKSTTKTISRYCDVFYVFENKMAQVGCKGYKVDQEAYKDVPNRLEFMVTNVEEAIAEVSELEGFKTKDKAELKINTPGIKAGRTVRVVAIFANGEALVEKTGYSFFNGRNVVDRGASIERVSLSDLGQL